MKTTNDIGFYLRKLNNYLEKLSHSLFNQKEIKECSLSNLWVIKYLTDNFDKNIYQKDIESEFSINRATASKMLSLMEEKKFIIRVPSDNDKRLKAIKILPEGEKLKKLCIPIRDKMEHELISCLTKEETENLRKILKKITFHFENNL